MSSPHGDSNLKVRLLFTRRSSCVSAPGWRCLPTLANKSGMAALGRGQMALFPTLYPIESHCTTSNRKSDHCRRPNLLGQISKVWRYLSLEPPICPCTRLHCIGLSLDWCANNRNSHQLSLSSAS